MSKSGVESESTRAADPSTSSEDLLLLWNTTKNEAVKASILSNPNLDFQKVREMVEIRPSILNVLMPISWIDAFFSNYTLPLVFADPPFDGFYRFLDEMAAIRLARVFVQATLEASHPSEKLEVAQFIYGIALNFAKTKDARNFSFEDAYEVIQNDVHGFPAKERPWVRVRKISLVFKVAAEDGDDPSPNTLGRLVMIYNMMQDVNSIKSVLKRAPPPKFIDLL